MGLLPAHREPLLPELHDLWNTFAPTGLGPMFSGHLLRVEDTVEDDRYTVRTEIPGVDPNKDIDVSVQGRQLVIKAERSEKKVENGHSEFSYGSFYRTVALPQNAETDKIEADYARGILTVGVPLREPQETAKKIEVTTAD
ncbi:Hsp20/alpha crystallin family protein [Nocardia sp. NPDC050193]|uniref:Hsp20/alpha crystallin family protein n=1 Tax=Nocardia testacea TaxID=248551 RepID=UPI00342C27BE